MLGRATPRMMVIAATPNSTARRENPDRLVRLRGRISAHSPEKDRRPGQKPLLTLFTLLRFTCFGLAITLLSFLALWCHIGANIMGHGEAQPESTEGVSKKVLQRL
ncbi:MAG: hypothetical protein DMG19_06365 [Acidobacteria bacterium]|nr:MAG: hypothetical protein DMG19_06365 [Acidobacteriota bacterium]